MKNDTYFHLEVFCINNYVPTVWKKLSFKFMNKVALFLLGSNKKVISKVQFLINTSQLV